MSGRFERILLYVVVLALALAVGWLAITINEPGIDDPPDCVGCGEELAPRFDAIDKAIADLGETVAESVNGSLARFKQDIVDDVAGRVGALVSDHGNETASALGDLDAAVTETIESGLAGLEERIATAVANKLLAGGCVLAKCDEVVTPPPCPIIEKDCDGRDGPPSIEVNSKFTFLYENARLNESRELVAESVGVKLAPRHLRRLELLTNAFRPCNRADAPVEFGVTGHSSSAEFLAQPRGEPLTNSDALNLKTANLRAKIVGDHLLNEGFKVEIKEWLSENDLQRPYLDDVQPGMDQQALNRTVFIELKSAGACDLAR